MVMGLPADRIALPVSGFPSCESRFRAFANAGALLGEAPAALPARTLGIVVAKMRAQGFRAATSGEPIVDALVADAYRLFSQFKSSFNLLGRPVLSETAGSQLP